MIVQRYRLILMQHDFSNMKSRIQEVYFHFSQISTFLSNWHQNFKIYCNCVVVSLSNILKECQMYWEFNRQSLILNNSAKAVSLLTAIAGIFLWHMCCPNRLQLQPWPGTNRGVYWASIKFLLDQSKFQKRYVVKYICSLRMRICVYICM